MWQAEVKKGVSPEGPVGGDPKDIGVYPLDEHNAKLLDLVAPKDWVNPTPAVVYDLVALGAGAGGLVSSKQTARRGGKSALIERHLAGGDCLNVGCVPSKALLRCARAMRDAKVKATAEFGVVSAGVPVLDFPKVMERMRRLRARIAPADSYVGAANLGVDVFQGHARFTGPNTIQVGETTLTFKTAVIATGGRAAVPNVPGLASTPFLTNASLYNLTSLPASMVVMGGGPIGVEMAQAFACFGCEITIVSRGFLSKEDPDAAKLVMEALRADGTRLELGCSVEGVEYTNGTFSVRASNKEGGEVLLQAEQLLVAAGRAPNVEGMGLEEAGVKYDVRTGVQIDDFMATSNPSVFAVGDVCSRYMFTHVAGTMASMVVDNAVFGERRRVSDMVIPWCTYTEPEVAHVGKYAHEIEGGCDTYQSNLQYNDRAILEGGDRGFYKVHCRKGTDQIVGGTIVADHAGDMLPSLVMCVQFGIPLGRKGLGSLIHAYPTVADGLGGCAFGYKMKTWKRVVDGKVTGGEPDAP